jgi:hypothetical protein
MSSVIRRLVEADAEALLALRIANSEFHARSILSVRPRSSHSNGSARSP